MNVNNVVFITTHVAKGSGQLNTEGRRSDEPPSTKALPRATQAQRRQSSASHEPPLELTMGHELGAAIIQLQPQFYHLLLGATRRLVELSEKGEKPLGSEPLGTS